MHSIITIFYVNRSTIRRILIFILFLIYCSSFFSLKKYPISLISKSYPKPIKIKLFKVLHVEPIFPKSIISEFLYPRTNLLTNDPTFSNRIPYIYFINDNYKNIERKSIFSLVITTYERPECFKKVFEKIIRYRPKYTEIIICDDGSTSQEKRYLLNTIAEKYKNEEVYVISHKQNYGSFHTKLDGFLFSVGDFIMSLDDDDSFDNYFYIDLSCKTLIELSYNDKINFVIPLHFDAYDWLKLPLSIEDLIYSFHNHVCFAFRRSLLCNIYYPFYDISIIKDDAALMIPLYSKTKKEQIVYFDNKYQYRIDSNCKAGNHQVSQFMNRKKEVLNGYYFLMDYLAKAGRKDLQIHVQKSYVYYM